MRSRHQTMTSAPIPNETENSGFGSIKQAQARRDDSDNPAAAKNQLQRGRETPAILYAQSMRQRSSTCWSVVADHI